MEPIFNDSRTATDIIRQLQEIVHSVGDAQVVDANNKIITDVYYDENDEVIKVL